MHYCEENSIELILSHPAVDAPQDIKGYPAKTQMKFEVISHKIPMGEPNLEDLLNELNEEDAEKQYEMMDVATFLPFGQMLQIIRATRPTIWFFDDFGHAPDSVQKALMQLLGDRELCGVRVPDCVKMLAATNGKEHKAGVTGLLEPVKSRFGIIVELVEDLAGFREYATEHNFYKDILLFLDVEPLALCDFRTDKGMEQSPNPRLWEKLSDQLYAFDKLFGKKGDEDLRNIVICGDLGSTWGLQYAAFERLQDQIPSYTEIVSDPENFAINQPLDIRICMLSMLATQGRPQHAKEIFAFTNKMAKEYQVVFFRYLRRYNETLVRSDPAQRWWAANMDIYVD